MARDGSLNKTALVRRFAMFAFGVVLLGVLPAGLLFAAFSGVVGFQWPMAWCLVAAAAGWTSLGGRIAQCPHPAAQFLTGSVRLAGESLAMAAAACLAVGLAAAGVVQLASLGLVGWLAVGALVLGGAAYLYSVASENDGPMYIAVLCAVFVVVVVWCAFGSDGAGVASDDPQLLDGGHRLRP